jgi:5-methylcytosine-specific restriction endonuclease McrA
MSRQQAHHFILLDPSLLRLAHRKNRESLTRIYTLTQRLAILRRKPIPPLPAALRYHAKKSRPLMKPPEDGWKAERWTHQNGRCFYCCIPLWTRFHLDHMIPKSKGGKNTPDNFAFTCEYCNLAKNDKSITDFMLWLLS